MLPILTTKNRRDVAEKCPPLKSTQPCELLRVTRQRVGITTDPRKGMGCYILSAPNYHCSLAIVGACFFIITSPFHVEQSKRI
jgi:hypothetical protein